MPIVPTVTSSATFTLGQTLSVITLERSGQVTTQTISEYTIYNAAPYSHDKVFVTPANDNLVNTLPAQLTKRYTYTSGCTDRWMLAGQQDLIRAFAHLTTATTKTIFFGEAVPKSIYVPPKLTVFSMSLHGTATDPDYARCQPYSVAAAIYSPGVCPDGLTMAEVTAYQEVASTGSRTFWQGSCCQRSVAKCKQEKLLT